MAGPSGVLKNRKQNFPVDFNAFTDKNIEKSTEDEQRHCLTEPDEPSTIIRHTQKKPEDKVIINKNIFSSIANRLPPITKLQASSDMKLVTNNY